MGNTSRESTANDGEKYNIAVIGDTSSGKTMLLLGLIMTSKKGLVVVSDDHKDDIYEMRKHLQKGIVPAGTVNLTTYNLYLQRKRRFGKAITYPLVFRDYKGGDIKDGISFFDQKFGDCDGVLFLMNPGQPVLNLEKEVDADDADLSMLTNLINGISGSSGDHKCRATAMAAAVTAVDRIGVGGDLYKHRAKFFDIFNRYIVNPLKNNSNGIACKTDYEISVTGHVESQDKLKIVPYNNAADPFLWLIARIERQKHPWRYWIRRLFPWLFVVILAVIGWSAWRNQNTFVADRNAKGEHTFRLAREEFKDPNVTVEAYKKHVSSLSNTVSELAQKGIWFCDAKKQKAVAYTNLLSKYLLLESDAAYLALKPYIKGKVCFLRKSECEIDEPKAFLEYVANGYSNEVEIARKRLADHQTNLVPVVISEYDKDYFESKRALLETNTAQVASQEYIQGLTNELAVWKQECSVISTLSNDIECVSRSIVTRCPAWRAAFASNIVQNVISFKYEVQGRPEEIFQFEKKKLGPRLRKLLMVEEPAAKENLDSAKKSLLEDCRKSYFEQEQFKTSAEKYPEDNRLCDNLNRLLQDTILTNSVSEWETMLHEKQRLWLRAEIERVKDSIQKAKDYSKFLMRPREGTGKRVHDLLTYIRKWSDEEKDSVNGTIFDADCKKIWCQFRDRYFAESKWIFRDNFEYPKAEDNLESKIEGFLEGTRIADFKVKTSEWLSKMREKQKQWLIGAIDKCKEFPDGFDAFDNDDGSSDEIKNVLVASWSFLGASIGETQDVQRVEDVKTKRKELVATMTNKYFKTEIFAPSYNKFSLEKGGHWSDKYRAVEEEMVKGLQDIFIPETGYSSDKITNEWVHALWRRERDWLTESQRMCTNEVNKFDQSAECIVQFVTKHPANPFLWDYVMGIKTKWEDVNLNQFKERLQRYAVSDDATIATELSDLEAQSANLHKVASVLSRNAISRDGQYAGLYDIFALRHLCTNCVPTNARRGEHKAYAGQNNLSEKFTDLVKKISDDPWMVTRYKISKVEVSLKHPDGVVKYSNIGDDDEDKFGVSIDKGIVSGDDDQMFLRLIRRINGDGRQADEDWKIVSEDKTKEVKLKLFSDLEFSGKYWEEYERRGKDPTDVGSENKPLTWGITIRTPHLRDATSLPFCGVFKYKSFANKRYVNNQISRQDAILIVSISGEVVGPTPYDRIDACINKAQEMESDSSNDWKQRCRKAEDRLKELNQILSEYNESDAGGQPR